MHLQYREIKEIRRRCRRRIYEFFGNPKHSKPSLNDLDDKLTKYLNYKNGFFIEVGANDGYSQSNTYYLEKILGWRGILVEAIPDLYEKCKKERKKAMCYNFALVEDGFAGHSVEMNFAGVMGLMSCVKDCYVGSHYTPSRNTDESYAVSVPARTLASILDEIISCPFEIDFFSLDVEGYELNVLRGINLSKYKPKYILVETKRLDEVDSFLRDKKYTMREQLTYHDYLYGLK
jgi:FkbM family methyltransferase